MVGKAINCAILIERMCSMCYKIGILKIPQINFDAYTQVHVYFFLCMQNMWLSL